MIEAVRAGMAVASLACYHGDADPALRRLVPEAITDGVADLWLLAHRDVRRSARVRTFMKFMSTAVAGKRDLIEGRRPL